MRTTLSHSSTREVKPILHLPNLLLISGSGRNVGKTTLGCKIIEEVAGKDMVIAIKVSSHFHPLQPEQIILINRDELVLAQETDASSPKDSSRYLQVKAGASLYAQCNDEGLSLLAHWISENIPKETPVVCESGGLGNYIVPGLALHLQSPNGKPASERPYPVLLLPDISDSSFLNLTISWTDQQWKI